MPTFHETTIETHRLLLRSMHATDIDALLIIFADPVVMAAFDAQPFRRAQMTQWVQRNLDHQHQYGYGLFSVLLKTNGLLIGNCGLEQMAVAGSQAAELGYDFRSDYWNQGYATEAANGVRDDAFQQLQLPRLISLIRQRNIPSQRVAEKVGMQRVEELVRYGTLYWRYEVRRSRQLNTNQTM